MWVETFLQFSIQSKCPIVERLTNAIMYHGRNNGKKMMAMRHVKASFEIIGLVTDQNPIQGFSFILTFLCDSKFCSFL